MQIVTNNFDNITEKEKEAYVKHVEEKEGTEFKYVTEIDISRVELDGEEYVDLVWHKSKPLPKFNRIRRITGYLVGTLDRFNDAKRAEEKDRVKHNV